MSHPERLVLELTPTDAALVRQVILVQLAGANIGRRDAARRRSALEAVSRRLESLLARESPPTVDERAAVRSAIAYAVVNPTLDDVTHDRDAVERHIDHLTEQYLEQDGPTPPSSTTPGDPR